MINRGIRLVSGGPLLNSMTPAEMQAEITRLRSELALQKELADELAKSPLLGPSNASRHIGKCLIPFDLLTKAIAALGGETKQKTTVR
jgi:hypothetical protein